MIYFRLFNFKVCVEGFSCFVLEQVENLKIEPFLSRTEISNILLQIFLGLPISNKLRYQSVSVSSSDHAVQCASSSRRARRTYSPKALICPGPFSSPASRRPHLFHSAGKLHRELLGLQSSAAASFHHVRKLFQPNHVSSLRRRRDDGDRKKESPKPLKQAEQALSHPRKQMRGLRRKKN